MLNGAGRALFGYTLATLAVVFTAQAQPAAAQAEAAPSEQDKAMHYSLYYEDFKNANYASAMPNLRWIITNAPLYPKNDARNYERLQAIYDTLATQATDPDLKRAYLDSSFALFDITVEAVKAAGGEIDEFEYTLNKGRFIQNNKELIADQAPSLVDIYKKAYQIAPDRLQDYYIQILINDVASTDKQAAVDFMDELEQKYPERTELLEYITQVRNALFKSPDERIAFLETRREKEPDNMEIITELFNLYRDEGNRAKIREIGEQMSKMEPSAQTYRILAGLRLGDGETKEAYALLEKAVEMAGNEATADDYYNMGIAQMQMGQLSKARSLFRKALDVNPKYGRAYMGIGDLYVTSVSNCGSFERDDRAVYWLAVDYYNRAKSADPSLASAANQKISAYSRSFPDAEMLFFKGWKAGQSYRVDYGCYAWIGETTTIKNP